MYQFKHIYKGELYQFSNPEKNILFSKVAEDFKAKGINYTDEDLMAAIERQSGMKRKIFQKPVVHRKKPSLAETIHGAKALLRYMGGSSVSSQELERRSAICNNCPLRDSVSDCMSCGGSGKVALFINQLRRSKKFEGSIPESLRKKFCGFCGCSLPLLLVSKFKDFEVESPQKNAARPDHCWLKKTSPNFTKE